MGQLTDDGDEIFQMVCQPRCSKSKPSREASGVFRTRDAGLKDLWSKVLHTRARSSELQ